MSETDVQQLQHLSQQVAEVVKAVREGRPLQPKHRWLLAIASGQHDPGPWPPEPGTDADAIVASAEAVLRELADLVDPAALDAVAARLQAIAAREAGA